MSCLFCPITYFVRNVKTSSNYNRQRGGRLRQRGCDQRRATSLFTIGSKKAPDKLLLLFPQIRLPHSRAMRPMGRQQAERQPSIQPARAKDRRGGDDRHLTNQPKQARTSLSEQQVWSKNQIKMQADQVHFFKKRTSY